MSALNQPLYYPALRMKAGELIGLRDLAPDVAEMIRPRLIVPPPAERDAELQARLFSSETFPDISTALAAYWRRGVLVDATYLFDEFERSRTDVWFPKMFEQARKAGARPIPLIMVDDLLSGDGAAYKDAIDWSEELKFGVALPSGSLGDRDVLARAIDKLTTIGLDPIDCVVIADFHDADFSDPDLVAPVIVGVAETLQAAAHWGQIAFQGTNYPEKNPSQPGSCVLVPRNEWIAWRRALETDRSILEGAVFGDYAADCAKIGFGRGGAAAAIRHYRYTTPNSWLVQRGADSGAHQATMQAVSLEIVKSGHFAGPDFSSADETIYKLSKGTVSSGGAREWRAVNTTHHITQVVADIAAMGGRTLSKRRFQPNNQLWLPV